jgi:citrate lyase subunit beta/citryl-CoA lyase
MTAPPRPRRSYLFSPGSNARALEKGRTLAADGLIFDLEDGVAPEAKDTARRQIADAIGKGGYGGRELVVRINAPGTEWFEADITAVAVMGADALLVPKVDDAGTVTEVVRRLEASGAPESMAVWCMIETARGVLNAAAIAAASPRLGAFLVGAADLSKDLRALHTPDRIPLLVSIELCILAARANGLAVLDSPFFDISDDAGFEHSCRQGRELGFDGKTLIHPKTIAGANAAFGPSPDEITWARRIIAAFDEAAAEGKGVTLVDGRLIEGLHATEARDLIALSDAIAEMEKAASGQ